jgi:hypothetical protein
MPAPQEPNEARLWWRQFLFLCLLTAVVHLFQFVSGVLLFLRATSPILLIFGLDAIVGAAREVALAGRIARHGTADVERGTGRALSAVIAVGYLVAGLAALVLGVVFLWQGRRPSPSFLGVGLAAISMLLIPIIGSYMKSLAMELKSPALKAAAVFTFGNSYLSMVLLIGLLISGGMQNWWGDPLGTIVMCPFIVQKGIQMLVEGKDVGFAEE